MVFYYPAKYLKDRCFNKRANIFLQSFFGGISFVGQEMRKWQDFLFFMRNALKKHYRVGKFERTKNFEFMLASLIFSRKS